MVILKGYFPQEYALQRSGDGICVPVVCRKISEQAETFHHALGRKLEFRIPRDRYGNFHPKILAILRNQEEECEKLAGSLYTKGLTQSQVGQVFDEIYGQHYSKSSISRMIDHVRKKVDVWLHRGLDAYYPIVFADCVHIKVFRRRKAASLQDRKIDVTLNVLIIADYGLDTLFETLLRKVRIIIVMHL